MRRALLVASATALAQALSGFLCGVLFASLFRSASPMGDLAGFALGSQVGFAAAASSAVLLIGRRADRSWWVLAPVALLVLPAQTLLVAFLVNGGAGFPFVVAAVWVCELSVVLRLARSRQELRPSTRTWRLRPFSRR